MLREFFFTALGRIWSGIINLPTPWQISIVIPLIMFTSPFFVLRITPLMVILLVHCVALATHALIFSLFWIFYQLERVLGVIGIDFNVYQNVESFLQALLKLVKDIEKYSVDLRVNLQRKKWIFRKKIIYFLPLLIFPIWFLRPFLGTSSAMALLMDKSFNSWCSFEHWNMTGEWKPSSLTCEHPNHRARWPRKFKLLEYQSKKVINDVTRSLDKGKRDNGQLLVKRADAFLYIEEYGNAYYDYEKAAELNRKYAPAYAGKGKVYLAQGDREMAFKEFSNARNVDPRYAPAYTGRGDVYQLEGDKDAALKEYREAYRLDPQYADNYYSQGKLQCYSFGNQVEAVSNYKMAEDAYLTNKDLVNARKVRESLEKLDTLYKVRSGDTLGKIAQRFTTSIQEIAAVNIDTYPSLGSNPDSIEVGWEIRIPACR